MRVLGISPLDKDSTVTVVEDGVIRYAAAEERFTRVKLQDGFPWQALQDALDRTGLEMDQFDHVAYPFLTWEEETRLFSKNLDLEREFLEQAQSSRTNVLIREALQRVPPRSGAIPGLSDPNERQEKGLAKSVAYRVLAGESVISRNVARRGSEQWGREAAAFHQKWSEELDSALTELGIRDRLRRIEHHVSHAANAYYTSGFDEALIVSLTGTAAAWPVPSVRGGVAPSSGCMASNTRIRWARSTRP